MATKGQISLTDKQSKAARKVLTISQKFVSDQTGLQAYKLKQFEANGFRLRDDEKKTLRDFYESQGVNFDELDESLKAQQAAEQSEGNQQRGITQSACAGFLISDQVTQDQMDSVLDRMDENDGRISELVGMAYKTGFFGSSDESEATLRELFGLLAESHLLFRFLQGKNVIEPVKKNPKTVGDMLAQWMQASPAYGVMGLSNGSSAQKDSGKQKSVPAAKAGKATAIAADVDGDDDSDEA